MNRFIANECLLLSVLTLSCTSGIREKGEIGKTVSVEQSALSQEQVRPLYTQGSRLAYADQYLLAGIQDPQNEGNTMFHYTFMKRGMKSTGTPAGYTVIELPIQSVIYMTPLRLLNSTKLDASDRIVGITSIRHLFNKEMNERLKGGKAAKIGIGRNFDNEIITSVNPDSILVSPFRQGGYEMPRDVGILLIPHLGCRGIIPLGQAEWIRFVGLLLGTKKDGNERFATIEERYSELKEFAADGKVRRRPIAFSGELRGRDWYAVGGKSSLAQPFEDAGTDYLSKDDKWPGGITLDFETVHNRADDVDYWRTVNSFPGASSYEALKEQDPRHEDSCAPRKRGIIYCGMKNTSFYENTPTEPEIVLADLLHISHPDSLPDHKSAYYSRFK